MSRQHAPGLCRVPPTPAGHFRLLVPTLPKWVSIPSDEVHLPPDPSASPSLRYASHTHFTDSKGEDPPSTRGDTVPGRGAGCRGRGGVKDGNRERLWGFRTEPASSFLPLRHRKGPPKQLSTTSRDQTPGALNFQTTVCEAPKGTLSEHD